MLKVGVLALQGSVSEHIDMLSRIEGVCPVEVKTSEQISEVDALILPGGESTTMGKLLVAFDLQSSLKKRIIDGMPVWGTCAGMILLASKLLPEAQTHLAVMDICVKRNAYGSQAGSFETTALIPSISPQPIPLAFIRAPYIESVGEQVEILCKIDNNIVAARENNMLATSFHPEVTDDDSVHRYFVGMIGKS
ncbi:MAG: pyridoxal 5'-phosphate synthase glutaminase subunit PdxT [Alkaliphilus sp.]|jgi:5'-phosphate synthase pdxT subunit|nr:pyridoxal 5'-phosphate synthase glutaminase subunit PdxT [bacterium AH-315-L21]MBN4056556.1 pyridoxal 5'-phosphate synthase glutaminase subunit PdxT [bacterium AH-315-K05]MBN4074309.1 pyridoxal 5'-phosphate synthase glutaminase subunit PdxT [bacterium AH-315-E09]PHS31782.1 MAG: pyridoxal 5'-phosphate synthase glutaminase subunit PdxT [Alkaliphilus sp.]